MLTAETKAPAFSILDHGAVSDGATLNTTAIQAAIDACAASGGGVVLVPPGRFVTGTFYLKSNVTLHLDEGATLLGSTDLDDYDTGNDRCRYVKEINKDRCLIYAEDCENIAITGPGCIDGQGGEDNFPNLQPEPPAKGVVMKTPKGYFPERPMGLRLKHCRNVRLKTLLIKDIPDWACHFIRCRDIHISRIILDSRVNYNTDGLDFDGCEDVLVTDSRFNCGDDAIALQTSERDVPCRNIRIVNCQISSDWAAVRLGPLSCGPFKNVEVDNCRIHDTYGGGLKMHMTEGSSIENVVFRNIVLDNVAYPVFISIGDCHVSRIMDSAEHEGGGRICGVRIENVAGSATGNIPTTKKTGYFHDGETKNAMFISGMLGFPVEDVVLENVCLSFPDGGSVADAGREVPEFQPGQAPFEEVAGILPAYALYARHVTGLKLSKCQFTACTDEARPAIIRLTEEQAY